MSIVYSRNAQTDLSSAYVSGGNYPATDGNWRGPWGEAVYRLSDTIFEFPGVTEGGCAFWFRSNGTSFGDTSIQFREGATNQFRFFDNDIDRKLGYQINAGGGEVFHGSWVWENWHYHWIEVEWKVADAGGYFKVWIDDVGASDTPLIDFSGDTDNAGAVGEITRIFFDLGIPQQPQFQDLIVWDKDGSGLEARPAGPCRLLRLIPDGDSQTGWSSTGANHHDEVDEYYESDDDTTRIYSAVATDKDRLSVTYDASPFELYPFDGEILAVIPRVGAAATVGTSDMDLGLRELGNDVEDVTQHTIDTTYTEYEHFAELNPDTGLPWTEADLATGIELVLEQQ